MAIKGSLTTGFAVSASKPSTKNQAGYDGLTWVPCGEAVSIGEFGREYNTVRVNNLASGATRKFKGSYDNGSMQVDLLFDSANNGQTQLEAAGNSTSTYAFRVNLPGGSGAEQFYFEGLVTTLKRVVGGPDDALMLRCTIELDHNDIIEGTQ